MSKAVVSIESEGSRAAHARRYSHGRCFGCGFEIEGREGTREAAFVEGLAGAGACAGARVRYHPRCAPRVALARAAEERAAAPGPYLPTVSTNLVAPSYGHVDGFEDFVTAAEAYVELEFFRKGLCC